MSHIYEALRRVSGDSLTTERGIRWSEDTVRPPDRFALEHYPSESRLSSTRLKVSEGERDHGEMPSVVVAPVEERVSAAPLSIPVPLPIAVPPPRASVDADAEGKLVATDGLSQVSVEQYRRLAAVLHDAQIESG